jgi:hypothetical protein
MLRREPFPVLAISVIIETSAGECRFDSNRHLLDVESVHNVTRADIALWRIVSLLTNPYSPKNTDEDVRGASRAENRDPTSMVRPRSSGYQ